MRIKRMLRLTHVAVNSQTGLNWDSICFIGFHSCDKFSCDELNIRAHEMQLQKKEKRTVKTHTFHSITQNLPKCVLFTVHRRCSICMQRLFIY